MYSYGPPHMAEQKQDNPLEHIYSCYVMIRDVALKTCQRWWTMGKSGERGSGISVLAARHDDDDETSCLTKVKEPSLLYNLHWGHWEKRCGFMPFAKSIKDKWNANSLSYYFNSLLPNVIFYDYCFTLYKMSLDLYIPKSKMYKEAHVVWWNKK